MVPPVRSDDESTAKSDALPKDLCLPVGKRISLHVLSGPEKGKLYVCERPYVAIGRRGVDFTLNDPRISQLHCVLEIFPDQIVLRDMDSANGTFVEDRRIRQETLANLSEFRIGDHTLALIMTPTEP